MTGTRTPYKFGHRDDDDSTTHGYLLDTNGNLLPMRGDNTNLTGSSAAVSIKYVYEYSDGGDAVAGQYWTDTPSKGSRGYSAGAAYIFKRDDRRWLQHIKLRGSDTDSYDFFGRSVSVDTTTNAQFVAAVGAPGAETTRVVERQDLYCKADGGYFALGFRGAVTAPIAHGATAPQFEEVRRAEEANTLIYSCFSVWLVHPCVVCTAGNLVYTLASSVWCLCSLTIRVFSLLLCLFLLSAHPLLSPSC